MSDATDGRYCYCLVRADGSASLDAVGIEEEPVHVVRNGDVGLVVHPCSEPYDSEDPIQVKRWLLAHQRVVDAAGEVFGTPLPFRFDTIIDGDDAAAREWLADATGEIDDALASFADHWEYRVQVLVDEDAIEDRLVEGDETLQELRATAEDDEGGTGFLRERQYEQRLKEARREWDAGITDRVLAAAEDTTREVREQGRQADLGGEAGGDAEGTAVARVAVLATEDGADAFGERLDDVAAEPGVEVRYTGPWPPYSFAPEFGGDG